ncbi:MAG: hypothetical protein ACRCS9_10740 [Hyphomicrobium sp.]
MKLKAYQKGELVGILFVLFSTAAQIFYVEPLKREIEWRLAAFNMQQNGQVQAQAIYGTRIATLKALKAPDADIKIAEAERDATIAQYKTADANIADFLFEKERIEGHLQMIVLALFAIGSLLAGVGRAMEMRAARQPESRQPQ